MLKIGIMGGSTRPSRKAPAVVEWVSRILKSREEEEFELVDTTDCKLLSSMNAYRRYHTTTDKTHAKTWSAKIASRQTGKACGALCIVECGAPSGSFLCAANQGPGRSRQRSRKNLRD